ncbi:LOW QUALITY PROTEIN: fibrinogen-like protein 1-like protein [Phaethornis superciliosus]
MYRICLDYGQADFFIAKRSKTSPSAFSLDRLNQLTEGSKKYQSQKTDKHEACSQKQELYSDCPRDCSEIFQHSKNSRDGLYIIQPKEDPIVVYGNMHDGGWTVILHITADSTVAFDRSWQDYKYGFGSVHDNHWLENEYMHQLNSSSVLGVKFANLDAETKQGQSKPFLIENEECQYQTKVSLYKGKATDDHTLDTAAYLRDNQKFTTKDTDNDNNFQNCATLEHSGIPGGGWWYHACARANLNPRKGIPCQKDSNRQHKWGTF